MTLPAQAVSPKATPLAPLPSGDPLNEAQWKTLLAIADAIIPPIKPAATANTQTEISATDNEYSAAISTLKRLSHDPNGELVAASYLQESASSIPAFREGLHRLLALYMPQSTRRDFILALNILG